LNKSIACNRRQLLLGTDNTGYGTLPHGEHALNEIKDQVGGVRLARTELIDGAYAALEQHRVVHLVGAGGSGKSSILKHIAQRLQPEGRTIVLRNGRIIAGGWLPMAHAIGCRVSLDELFNELGCGGGATLFVDNIDQIDEPGDWATASDLLTGVARNPGWRAVVTGGLGNDEWKSKLSALVRDAGIATLEIGAISDDEVAVLSEGNQALAIILSADHPARGIARYLFYLSRMIELGAGQAGAAASIATEIDLARLWWRYGGGRAEDDGRFARLKVLRAVGAQVISNPGRTAFKVDELDSSTVASLLRFDSLQEDIKGATVAFRHDVLRDWTVGFLLHENKELLSTLPMDGPVATGLGRGLEIAARLALDSDATGADWLALLAAVDREGVHGSWKRPVLLALPRSEQALALFMGLKSVLLESGGRRLSEIIRLMIAVESIPLAKVIARAQSAIAIPPGVEDLIVPKGLGWTWLVLWLVTEANSLPSEIIPDVAKVFQAWLISTQNQFLTLNAGIVGLLFDWLSLIEDEMVPRVFKDISEVPPPLNISHLTDVRDEVRMSAFAFARLNPTAAAGYLSVLDPDTVRHREAKAILGVPGSLAQAAPAELADFALGTLIEKEDPDDFYRGRHDRYGPFGVNDHLFLQASPSQGPFLDLLEHAPAEGLRLIRGLVEHATNWRREQHVEARRPFPRVTVPFPGGSKSFEGDQSIYHWARSVAPSTITATALMALEAWGHQQTEAGRPFEDVLHDVLGPDGSSVAFVSVAVDLVLSHWPASRDYEASDRDDILIWAQALLNGAAMGEDKEYHGNDQIEYNSTAIATVGLVALYLRDQNFATRDTLLHLACHQHPAVERALGQHFANFARVDERIPRALVRIVMVNCVHPHRTDSDDDDRVNQRARRERVEAAIVAEQRWLGGAEGEPALPDLPSWWSRPRRGFRLGVWAPDEDEEEEIRPNNYVDERTLGALISHLIPLTMGPLPPWVVPLSSHLMQWTCEANGLNGADDRDQDHRPSTWNRDFFDFAGVLSVALPHSDVVKMFVAPITQFRDEAFYDAMAEFVRGFDRATLAIDTKTPENPAAVRKLLADRIRQGRNFRRYEDEKTFSSEMHAGDALTAMFYQRSSFANDGKPSIPGNWDGLDATISTLTELVTGAGSSGYLAVLFLNLAGSSPRAALLPYVVKATTAWCAAYGVDANFWSEKDIGGRVCGWIDRMLEADSTATVMLANIADDLIKCLDVLIRSGVAQASEIEERISGMTLNRKTA
jgi:energy-coupling factor transporter ATP-binding protein EcfA2